MTSNVGRDNKSWMALNPPMRDIKNYCLHINTFFWQSVAISVVSEGKNAGLEISEK